MDILKEAKIVESFGNDIVASMSLINSWDIKAVAYSCVEVGKWLRLLLDNSPITEAACRSLDMIPSEGNIAIGMSYLAFDSDVQVDFKSNVVTNTKPVGLRTVSDLAKALINGPST